MPLTDRRRFLLLAASAAPLAAHPGLGVASPLPHVAPASPSAAALAPRVLSFSHLHTGEKLTVEYFGGGVYLDDALAAVNRLLRDFRSGDVAPIAPDLLDQLHAVAVATGTRKPFEVISGYRSPGTNETLRNRRAASGVAKNSLHLHGRAIDVRLADVPLASLRDAARQLGRGGVGYYPGSNFVHLDTGRPRAW